VANPGAQGAKRLRRPDTKQLHHPPHSANIRMADAVPSIVGSLVE